MKRFCGSTTSGGAANAVPAKTNNPTASAARRLLPIPISPAWISAGTGSGRPGVISSTQRMHRTFAYSLDVYKWYRNAPKTMSAEPAALLDHLGGSAGYCLHIGAFSPPSVARPRQLIQMVFPIRLEQVLQIAPEPLRQTGAAASRRDRQQQVAAPDLRRRVEVAEVFDILDIDQPAQR